MSIDIATDELLTLDDARQWLGRRLGHAPSAITLRRWVSAGIKGVVLESVLVGGRRATSVEAIERFIWALSGEKNPTPSARRRREIAQVNEEAERLFGVKVGGGGE